MLNPRIWPWFNLGLFFFGDSTLMRHSHRFPFFTTIFSVLLVISWFSDFNQIKPPDGLTFQTTLKQAFFEAVPGTAANGFNQKNSVPDDGVLLPRALRPETNDGIGAGYLYWHPEGLQEFIEQVSNGVRGDLVGIFVEDVLALPVVQQPAGDTLYVSRDLGNVTQFESARLNGVVGLLAHNYLSGELFYRLELSQVVNLVHGVGHVTRYLIEDIQRFEKLEGDFYSSNYVNLETGEVLTTPELFRQMYTGNDKVTFQTCIKNGSDWSWGRIFIIATPLS
jgi:hypothetical protein